MGFQAAGRATINPSSRTRIRVLSKHLGCAVDQGVDLFVGDHQGRRNNEAVVDVAHHKAGFEADLAGEVTDRARRGGKGCAPGFVGRQLERAHEADDLRLTDQGMVRQAKPLVRQIRSDVFAYPVDKLLLRDDGEIFKGDSAGHRMAGIGVAVEELAPLREPVGHVIGDDGAADGLVAGA